MHGANQANCTKRYRRQTISDGERKGKRQPEEEPYTRGKRGQEGGVGVLI